MSARILVVDDDPVNLNLVRQRYTRAGFEIHAVDSVERALPALAEHRFGLIISDILMPGASGIDLLQHVRNNHPGVRVIMMTGVLNPDDVLTCMQLGADTLCFKPLNLPELDAAVERAMDTAQRWREILHRLRSPGQGENA